MAVNHKPKLSTTPHETTITPSHSRSENSCNLSIKVDSDGNAYSYTGPQRSSEACALIYDPNSQTLTLDKISTEFTFNLHATPTNKSSKTLASQYPHLPTGDSEPESNSDDLLDENDLSAGADVNNPYDYRHFLKRRRTSSSEALPSTPLVPASPPRHVPVRQKPKPRARPQQKRAPSPPPREEADADNEESDDGGLTILDPDAKPRRVNLPFIHDLRNGPTSLTSATSSVSPAVSVSSDEDEDVEKLSLEPPAGIALTPGEQEDDEDDEEEEEDREDEEDDDQRSLEAELEQALESQADEEESGGVHVYGNGLGVNGLGVSGVRTELPMNPIVDESSSESEEE